MSITRTLIFTFWMALLMGVYVHETEGEYLGRLCGRKLTQMLKVVCNSQYATVNTNKRSDEMYEYDYQVPADEPIFEQHPLLSKLLPNAPFRTRFRRDANIYTRRGVVDECCYKSCTYKELSQYCLNDPL